MKKSAKIGLSVLFVVCCLASFRLGIYVTMDALETHSTDSQAMFAFNHIGNYSKIKQCLDKGMLDAASIYVDNFLITERELLATHLNEGVSPRMVDYITLRTSDSFDAHKAFTSQRGGQWSAPSCQ